MTLFVFFVGFKLDFFSFIQLNMHCRYGSFNVFMFVRVERILMSSAYIMGFIPLFGFVGMLNIC